MTSFYIPVGTAHYQQEIKRSRFLASIKHTETPALAKAWINEIRDEYPHTIITISCPFAEKVTAILTSQHES